MEKLEKIIKLLKPKYYNRITYLLVIAGISLLTKPLWIDLLNWGINVADENYKQIRIPIIGEWDWLLGLGLIVISLTWNTYNRLIDLKFNVDSKPAYKKVNKIKMESFNEFCTSIYPILKDNEYIFQTFGPNSGAEYTDELRTDLTLWYKYRSEAIIPNNQKIKEIILGNQSLLDRDAKTLADRMTAHIDVFEEHLKNPSFDYSDFKFPNEFKVLIEETCFNEGINSKIIEKSKKWINKKLKKIEIEQWYFFGSYLFVLDKAKDCDIVLLLNGKNQEQEINKIESLRLEFKISFKKNLHFTTFIIEEKEEFLKFIENNNYKLKGNNG